MNKKGPIEKAFFPGQNYQMTFGELKDYFEKTSFSKRCLGFNCE